jgi:hypothetical protein
MMFMNGEFHILTTISEVWVLVAHRCPLIRIIHPDPYVIRERFW